MTLEIQQRQCAEHFRVAHRRRQMQRPMVDLARDQLQPEMQGNRAAIVALQIHAHRLEQPRQHERQRLDAINRPFERETAGEHERRRRGRERPAILTARQTLPPPGEMPQPGEQTIGRQRGEVAERFETPAIERGKRQGW